MSKILSIDFGTKRCGIAVTDESQIIASGLTTVETKNLMSFLSNYFRNNDVEKLIIGEPKTLNNEQSVIEPKIIEFIEKIKNRFLHLEIVRVDERFTSKLAFQAMIDAGLKKNQRRNKQTVDMVSATIILQDFLHFRNK
ncbi:MAG: Holliday junction resolvase RuvX [Flavobacteriaceae bacterium]|jgi:putative Holliday junction resolvase|nr:Holliday junction resolvase RuvX [Flavobacteriaceae bacterium]